MMNLLITGLNGFVGQNLIEYLGPRFNIRGLSIRYIQNQIFKINADVIIHLAGKAHDIKKVSNPSDYYESNYELTKQLYDAFLISGAEKFIYLSSVKAAADSLGNVMTEDYDANPQSHYGKSKLMAEEYIRAQPLPKGKSYFILRPCMIHGPGNKGNLNLLYKFVKKGIPYPLAAFENERSFLSIENLCFVIKELAAQKGLTSGIYNIADDESLSTNEVVSILGASLGRKPKLLHISKSLIFMLCKAGDKLNFPINTERLIKLTESYVVSNEKIKKLLNVKLPLRARDGLLITANSFD